MKNKSTFSDSNVWQSLGRRVFDIYIQGDLASKDFDIRKGAGGSFRAVTRYFAAQVTDNHLEIHLFWDGKGTCCVPIQGTYGPSISAIIVTPQDFIPTVGYNNGFASKNNNSNKAGLIVGITVPIAIIGFVSIFAIYYYCVFCRRKTITKNSEDQELLGIKSRPYNFSYAELKAATDDFSSANKLGDGGFGPVYKGTLEDGRVIAVKRLSVPSRQVKSQQVVSEIATVSSLQHHNLVKLHGFCIEGDKTLLVYEYVENKISLDQALYGNLSLSFAIYLCPRRIFGEAVLTAVNH